MAPRRALRRRVNNPVRHHMHPHHTPARPPRRKKLAHNTTAVAPARSPLTPLDRNALPTTDPTPTHCPAPRKPSAPLYRPTNEATPDEDVILPLHPTAPILPVPATNTSPSTSPHSSSSPVNPPPSSSPPATQTPRPQPTPHTPPTPTRIRARPTISPPNSVRLSLPFDIEDDSPSTKPTLPAPSRPRARIPVPLPPPALPSSPVIPRVLQRPRVLRTYSKKRRIDSDAQQPSVPSIHGLHVRPKSPRSVEQPSLRPEPGELSDPDVPDPLENLPEVHDDMLKTFYMAQNQLWKAVDEVDLEIQSD